jgi:tetrahydromethanopterin S-methyltransferase subunit G
MKDDTTKENPGARSFEERVFARLDAIDARFDAIDARFDAIEARLDGIERRFESRFELVDKRFEAIESRLDRIEENVGTRFAVVDQRFSRLEELVDSRLKETRPIWEGIQFEMRRLNAKFEQYVEDLFELRAGQKTLRKRVDVLEGVTN